MFLAWLEVCLVITSTVPKKTYDHQTKTYVSSFKPVAVKGKLSIEGFFSPDHSVDTLSSLIATASKTLDIGTPSVSTWLRRHHSSDCSGISVSKQSAEKFPLFNATLNALHRGVKVRLLTNNYGDKLCPNTIDPLTFLHLAGVEVTYYASTSFMHAKYIQVDGKKASVSSVNWSRNSFMNNREAGMIVSSGDASDSAAPLLEFLTSVFEDDLRLGIPYTNPPSFSDTDLEIISNIAVRPVSLPSPPSKRAFVSPVPEPVTSDMEVVAFTSPDYALTTLEADVSKATSTLEIYTYQINNDDLCELLLEKHRLGVSVKILVSPQIFSKEEEAESFGCYDKLIKAGLQVNMVHKYDLYYFSHNKFWIVDGKRVNLCTGNWAPTDFPGPPHSYPPYGETGWRKTNRDFTLRVTDPQIVHLFRQVMQGDMKKGTLYTHKVSGNCATLGCSSSYQPDHTCQCTANCKKYHNCCEDFKDVCSGHNTPTKVSGTCATFGCTSSYQPGHTCQCTANCKKYHDCCEDFQDVCSEHSTPTKTSGSCAIFGCTSYQPTHECQCNTKCAKYHNCCDDFPAVCLPHTTSESSNMPGSCALYGCISYRRQHSCQCNDKCAKYNNCCNDYKDHCSVVVVHG